MVASLGIDIYFLKYLSGIKQHVERLWYRPSAFTQLKPLALLGPCICSFFDSIWRVCLLRGFSRQPGRLALCQAHRGKHQLHFHRLRVDSLKDAESTSLCQAVCAGQLLGVPTAGMQGIELASTELQLGLVFLMLRARLHGIVVAHTRVEHI